MPATKIIPLHARPATDLQQVAALMMATWPAHYGPMGHDIVLDHVVSRARLRGLPFGVVALDAEQVIGTAALAAESFGSDGAGPWLIGLAVAASYRRKGVGTALIAGVTKAARRQGFGEIFTTTQVTGLFVPQGWAPLRTVSDPDSEQSWSVLCKKV